MHGEAGSHLLGGNSMKTTTGIAVALVAGIVWTSSAVAAPGSKLLGSWPRVRSAVQRPGDRFAHRTAARQAPDADAPLPDELPLEDAPLPDDAPPAEEAPLPDDGAASDTDAPADTTFPADGSDEMPADDSNSEIPEAPTNDAPPRELPRTPYMTPPEGDSQATPPPGEEEIAAGELSTADWLGGGGCSDDCCSDSCDPCRGKPGYRVYFMAEALWLNLSRPGYQTLAETNGSTPGTAVLSTRNLDPGSGVGPRFRLGWLFGRSSSVELDYFGLNHWSSTNQVLAPGSINLPGPLHTDISGFSQADRFTAGYAATIQNAEANYLHRLGASNFQMLFGFRYLGFNEKLNLQTKSPQVSNHYAINARNQLFGLQCGSRYLVQFWRIGIEGIGKAGLYGNDALQRTHIGPGSEATNWLLVDKTGGNLAFIGELGLNGMAQISNWLYIRGGYNLFWLQGVARAADQLALTTSPGATVESAHAGSLVHNRGAFLHGASVGLEVRW